MTVNRLKPRQVNPIGSKAVNSPLKMLQDARAIRYYQRITDALGEQWKRGYRNYDELRLYLDGYLAALRHADAIEPYLLHRLEEDVVRFAHDSSNFAMPESEPDYY